VRETPPDTARTLQEIKTRGYRTATVRPSKFEAERISAFARLEEIVQSCAVRLRGWDFPQIVNHYAPNRGKDYVEQAIDWQHHRELWRMYQSGQFTFVGGLWNDWQDRSAWGPAPEGWQPGDALHVEDTVYFYMEVFEFAARLAMTEAGDNEMRVMVSFEKLKGRYLKISPERADRGPHQTAMDRYEHTVTLERQALVAEPRRYAAMEAQRLLERFGADIALSTLEDIQAQLKR
jgi:hypothetical protein